MVEAPVSARGTTTVTVDLGTRSYDVLIGRGLVAGAGAAIVFRLPGARVAVVTDQNVAPLYLTTLTEGLTAAGVDHVIVTVPPGEASKSYEGLETVVDAVLAARIERGDAVVALGGGVVGDLAGFAAAIVRRGIGLIQVPTTLLAQVDSAIGGKTGINTRHGKNLVGAFHQPLFVLADPGVLDSLPPRVFNAGYAEVAKYGLIGDAAFFAWLEANWRVVATGGPEREEAIATACRAKAGIVAADERENGVRALLNFGHTFGHAIEAAAGYSERVLHGEAVSIGMVLAHEFSARRKLAPPEETARIVAHLSTVGLPVHLGDIPGDKPTVEALMTHVVQDKKVTHGQLNLILTRGIGRAFIANDVPVADVAAFLAEKLAA